VIPENIHIPPVEGTGNSRGVGVGVKGPEKSRERRGVGVECNITPYPQDINILPKHSQNSWLRLKNKKKEEVVTLVPS